MNPPVEAPTSRQSSPAGSTPKRIERVRKLPSRARHVRRRALHLERRRLVDLLPRLGVPRDEPCHDERLRLGAALREPALDEQDVQSLPRHDVRAASRATISASTEVSAGISASRASARAAASSASSRALAAPTSST